MEEGRLEKKAMLPHGTVSYLCILDSESETGGSGFESTTSQHAVVEIVHIMIFYSLLFSMQVVGYLTAIHI